MTSLAMENSINENTCRICFQKQDTLFSLYRKLKGFSPYDKLVNNTTLKIAMNDGGPSSICSQCLIELDTTVNFLIKCEDSNRILASLLAADAQECSESNVETRDNICYRKEDVVFGYFQQSESVERMEKEDIMELIVDEAPVTKQSQKSPCFECGSRRRCRHRASPKSHICQYCHKVFTRKFNFTLHLKRHLGEREWPCPACGALQLTRWLAQRHCAPRPRRACPAPGCGKTFTTNTNLNTHIRVHSGERPYKCDQCSKSFTCKNTLNDHIRIHTGVKPYMCPVCGKRFTTNKLSAHMLSHSTRRAHACAAGGCTRVFKCARALAAHALTHARNAGYSCAMCTARYNHKQSLNKHLRKHHGQQTNINNATKNIMKNQIECVV